MLNPNNTKQTESLKSIETINTIQTNLVDGISSNGKICFKNKYSKSLSISKFKTVQEQYDLCRKSNDSVDESNLKEYIIYYTMGNLIIRPMGFFYGIMIDEFSEITPYILRRSNGEIVWIKFNSENQAMLADHTYLYETITAPRKNSLIITIKPENKSIIQIYGEMYNGFSFQYPSTIDLKGKLFLVRKNSEDGFREDPIENNCTAIVRNGILVVFICDNRDIAILSDNCQMTLKMEKSSYYNFPPKEQIVLKKKQDSLSDLRMLIKNIQLKLSQQKDEIEKPKFNEFEQSLTPVIPLENIAIVSSVKPIEKILPIEPQEIIQPEKKFIKQLKLKEKSYKEIKEISHEPAILKKFGDYIIKSKDFKEVEQKIEKKSESKIIETIQEKTIKEFKQKTLLIKTSEKENKTSESIIKESLSSSSSLPLKLDSAEQIMVETISRSPSSFSKLKKKIQRKTRLSAKSKNILLLLTKPSSTELIGRKSSSPPELLSMSSPNQRIFKRKKIIFKKRSPKSKQNLKSLMRPPKHKDSIKKSRSLFAKSLISATGSRTFSPSTISSEIIKRAALKNLMIGPTVKSPDIDESITDKQEKITKNLSVKSDELSESIQVLIEIFRNKLSKVRQAINSFKVNKETLLDPKIQDDMIESIEELIKTGRNILTQLIRDKKLDRQIENQMDTDLKQLNKFKQDFISIVKEKEKPKIKIKSKNSETIAETLNCIESIDEIIKKI